MLKHIYKGFCELKKFSKKIVFFDFLKFLFQVFIEKYWGIFEILKSLSTFIMNVSDRNEGR